MIRRALVPGGCRQFAFVAAFEVGVKGRICEIVAGSQERNGEWRIVVEGGSPCQVLDITPEALQDSEPLLHGNLLEVDEDELDGPPDALVPLIAASQMVDLLGSLGRHLRQMRRRRLLLALSDGREGVESDDESRPNSRAVGIDTERELATGATATLPQTRESGVQTLRQPAGTDGIDGESREPPDGNYGAMLGLIGAYRQIISHVDRLLAEATETVDGWIPLMSRRHHLGHQP